MPLIFSDIIIPIHPSALPVRLACDQMHFALCLKMNVAPLHVRGFCPAAAVSADPWLAAAPMEIFGVNVDTVEYRLRYGGSLCRKCTRTDHS